MSRAAGDGRQQRPPAVGLGPRVPRGADLHADLLHEEAREEGEDGDHDEGERTSPAARRVRP